MKECPACKRCFPDEISNCPDDGTVTAPTLLGEPTLDGRYLLECRLGQGGMGVVFKGRHAYLKTLHAIKVILPDLVGNDPMLATRFRQEALAAAAIRHQNVISVTDFGVVRDQMPFLVMEFIKGTSLHDTLQREGPMPVERAWDFISALASGVGAAHRQKIIHRDLKPLNVMVQDGLPVSEGLKILDFGLAKIKSGEVLGSFVQAQTTGLMGSPYYMAPEQWSDEELDVRADVYSLGVILFQMLCGDVPFKGSSIPSVMKKHLTLPPPTFRSFGISVPPAIEAVVRHALEKDVGARIDSVDTFLSDLREAIDSSAAALRPPAPTLVDLHLTGSAMTDTQPPGPGPSTRVPVHADTQLSTSASSMPELSMPLDQEKSRSSQAQQTYPKRVDEESLVPGQDPEETRVRQPYPQLAGEASQLSRPDVGRPLVIDLPPQKRTTPVLLMVGAVVFLLIVTAGIGGYFIYRWSPEKPTLKAELIAIDGGTFEMGRNNGPPPETPAHSVTVDTFSIDKTEVTNSEYSEFVAATGHVAPAHWVEKKPPAGQELWPVVGVSLDDANVFAAWRSERDKVTYRLPTEQEWEYAARNGSLGDLYPWGSQWQDGIAVVKESSPAPVGSRPVGHSRKGIADLIGNVWEWTSSRVSVYPGNSATVPDGMSDWVTIRGGSCVSDPQSRERPVTSYMRDFVPPGTKSNLLGFRLVRSGK